MPVDAGTGMREKLYSTVGGRISKDGLGCGVLARQTSDCDFAARGGDVIGKHFCAGSGRGRILNLAV